MISTSVFDGTMFEIFGFKIMGSIVLTWALMIALACIGLLSYAKTETRARSASSRPRRRRDRHGRRH